MDKEYIYFFLHIGKTGGSTLEKHVRKSYKREEYLELNYTVLNLDESVNEYKKIYSAVEKYINSLSKKRKNKIKFVYGHLMPYGIHKLFNKKHRYITIIRDPLRRVISNYNYLRKLYEFEDDPTDPMYSMYLLVDGKVPTFDDWFRKKFIPKHRGIGNLTYKKVFEANGFLKNDNYENMLKKFFFIDILEDDRDMFYLFELLKINKFFINQNVSKKYVRINSVKKENEYKKSLSEGYKIYKKATMYSKKKKTDTYYKHTVLKIRLKRALYLPVTQILFDLKGLYASIKERIIYKIWDI